MGENQNDHCPRTWPTTYIILPLCPQEDEYASVILEKNSQEA
jgi:hypothetical protein